MSKKYIASVFIIAVVTVFMVACCEDWDEQKCLDEHVTLQKKGPWGPTTPIIILEARPGGGGVTQWTYAMPGGEPVVQGDSGTSMFSDCTTCALRDDFMGAKVMFFDYLPKGGTTWNQATKIVAKKGDIKMEITKVFSNIYYRIEDKSVDPVCWCVAYTSQPINTGVVPSELYEFDMDEFKHITGSGPGVEVEKVRIKTYVLTE